MFNLFKKKYQPILEYKENWAILQDKNNLNTIRINMGYKDAIGHPDYPLKMGIAIPVKDHDEVIMNMKYEIEDFLMDDLFKNQDGVLVAVITGIQEPKFIEFLSYVKGNVLDFEGMHKNLIERFKDYDVQMYANQDENWGTYKSLARS